MTQAFRMKYQVFVNGVAYGKICDTDAEALTDAAMREHAWVRPWGIEPKAPFVAIRMVKVKL